MLIQKVQCNPLSGLSDEHLYHGTSSSSLLFVRIFFYAELHFNYDIKTWNQAKKRTIRIIYTQLPIDVVNSVRCFCSQNFNHFHCGKRWFNVTSKQMDCFVQLLNCLSVLALCLSIISCVCFFDHFIFLALFICCLLFLSTYAMFLLAIWKFIEKRQLNDRKVGATIDCSYIWK